jgi:3-phosphoshikimate 1-carboxyvinyltransferase
MMHALGVPLRAVGSVVELDPSGWSGTMPGFDIDIPGDASAAAFLVVAANITPGSRVTVRGVGVNPTRTGLLEIARLMGAGIEVVPQGEQAGEPIAEITAWHEPMRGIVIGGEIVPRAIDEIPIACALAARASGTTTIRDAEELRVKESDRIATMAHVLRAFGVTCEELPDGLTIEGKEGPLAAAAIDSRGDHRIAMTATILALSGKAPSEIRDVDCIATSFPRFVGTLRALGARIDASPTLVHPAMP